MSRVKICDLDRGHHRAQRLTASEVCPGDEGRGGANCWDVLNALRHQRCVQKCPHSKRSGIPLVLNALRHQRCVQHRVVPQFWPVPSAQRLTASEVCPELVERSKIRVIQKCSTPYGIRGVSRSAVKVAFLVMSKCSTPYGIRGVSRSCRCRRACSGCPVLNALRHQRCVQLLKEEWKQPAHLCSTPYGIRGVSSMAPK